MKYKTMTRWIASTLGLSSAASAEMSKQEMKAEFDRISMEYKAATKSCDQKSGNAKDIGKTEANGAEKVTHANIEARNKGTAQAAAVARIIQADAAERKRKADYEAYRERCYLLATCRR
jgi:hypothetical protein